VHNTLTQALFEMFPPQEKGDFYHAFIYLKHLDHFMYHALRLAGNPTKRPESPISDDVDEMLEAAIQTVAETAGSRETSTYHGKIVQLKDALQLVTQKMNVSLQPPETVIPYKQARDIIIENPESISVGECACRAAAETSCLPPGAMDVCLFVGDPHASFVGSYNPKFRKISQREAVDIIEEVHRKGFVHCAFFKKDLGRRFVAICNCCSCCCQGMKAWKMFGGAIPVLAPSGYVCLVTDDCNDCGACIEACHFDAITSNGIGQKVSVDDSKCMGCGLCEDSCPCDAIRFQREPSKGDPLDLAALMSRPG